VARLEAEKEELRDGTRELFRRYHAHVLKLSMEYREASAVMSSESSINLSRSRGEF